MYIIWKQQMHCITNGRGLVIKVRAVLCYTEKNRAEATHAVVRRTVSRVHCETGFFFRVHCHRCNLCAGGLVPSFRCLKRITFASRVSALLSLRRSRYVERFKRGQRRRHKPLFRMYSPSDSLIFVVQGLLQLGTLYKTLLDTRQLSTISSTTFAALVDRLYRG